MRWSTLISHDGLTSVPTKTRFYLHSGACTNQFPMIGLHFPGFRHPGCRVPPKYLGATVGRVYTGRYGMGVPTLGGEVDSEGA